MLESVEETDSVDDEASEGTWSNTFIVSLTFVMRHIMRKIRLLLFGLFVLCFVIFPFYAQFIIALNIVAIAFGMK